MQSLQAILSGLVALIGVVSVLILAGWLLYRAWWTHVGNADRKNDSDRRKVLYCKLQGIVVVSVSAN